jgi:hypothetical protein
MSIHGSELKPATEADVDQGAAIFWVPDSRSKVYDLGVPLPVKATVKVDMDLGNGQYIPAGTLVHVTQSEIVDDSDVLLGFVYSGGQGICELDQITLQSGEVGAGPSKGRETKSLVTVEILNLHRRDIKELALKAIEQAKQDLQRDKHLVPAAFIVKDNEAVKFVLTFEGPGEKRAIYDQLIDIAKSQKALAIVTVNDAYCSETGSADLSDTYYEGKLEAERSCECIYATLSGPAIVTWSIIIPYARNGEEIIFRPGIEHFGDHLGLLRGWASLTPDVC